MPQTQVYTLDKLCDIDLTPYDVNFIVQRCGGDRQEYCFPDHQRRHRWSQDENVRFIVSLIQNVPISEVHLCEASIETRTHKKWINDGGHRLRCMYQYYNNMWPIPVRDESGDVFNVYFSEVPEQPGVRVKFTDKTENKILRRQRFACNICKKPFDQVTDSYYELDHIKPRWEGGSTDDDNCQALCIDCHREKTAAEATRRSKQPTGSSNDRVMTVEEQQKFLDRKIPVIIYSNYHGDPMEIQREIFDRVQQSANMGVHDYISSHTQDPLVIHMNGQLRNESSALSRMNAVITEIRVESNDWWSTETSDSNIFSYVVALYKSIATTAPTADDYNPAKANKLTEVVFQDSWASKATASKLKVFDKVLKNICNLLQRASVRRILYSDFAVLCHCYHRWGSKWLDAADDVTKEQLAEVFFDWQSASLTSEKILVKMGTLNKGKWKPGKCITKTRKRARLD